MSNVSSGTVDWDDQVLRDLLTLERLSSYLQATGHDLGKALRLYEWNMAASASVLATTGMVEIVVRNALDKELVSWAATRLQVPWLDGVPLDQRGLDDRSEHEQRPSRGTIAPVRHRAWGWCVGRTRCIISS